jgi:hypothetical protein
MILFRVYARKRKTRGAHSESPFGAQRKQDDPEEGFPFLASTFAEIVRTVSSGLGDIGKAGQEPGAGTAGEVGAGEGKEKDLEDGEEAGFKAALLKELYAMGAWVFQEAVQELQEVSTNPKLLCR